MSKIISLHNLKKSFFLKKKEIPIFDDVTMDFLSSKIYALIGASGAGKSTLLNLIAGLDHPIGGEIQINQQTTTLLNENNLAKFRNENIGFVFQQHCLIRELTALENILLPTSVAKNNKNKKKYAQWLLEKIQLSHRKNHLAGELSGGEMQRVSIARALINQPAVILADEPTGNLDDKNAEFIFTLLKELAKENAAVILLATHNIHLAQRCDAVVTIKNQKLTKYKWAEKKD